MQSSVWSFSVCTVDNLYSSPSVQTADCTDDRQIRCKLYRRTTAQTDDSADEQLYRRTTGQTEDWSDRRQKRRMTIQMDDYTDR